MTGLPHFPRLAGAVLLAAAIGVGLDLFSPAVRDWLYHRPFTGSVLVGTLLIGATYLIVERALADRERRRWDEITQPLLQEIAAVVAGHDTQIRRGTATPAQCDRLLDWLVRYQPVLTATADLTRRWHDALSVAQHAAIVCTRGGTPDDTYEAAWGQFQRTFADIHDFGATPQNISETFKGPAVTAALPACPRCGKPTPPDADFCSCGEYLRWEATGYAPAVPRGPDG
jgi:hypothetical protein